LSWSGVGAAGGARAELMRDTRCGVGVKLTL
jgi:hypothetical protein